MKPDAAALAVARSICGATGTQFEPTGVEAVGGGCIHTAIALDGNAGRGTKRYFAKLDQADREPMFAAEADGLEALRAAGCVRVPDVIARGEDGEHSWLALAWHELVALDAPNAAKLGTALAAQHRVPQQRFGWGRDNFIGATPQPNGWSDDWLAFWRGKRLMAQLRLAAKNRLPSKMIDRGERLAADCEALFRGREVKPSLLHGDLWGGNAAADAHGPIVFDPAVYVGDAEADLAMTGLFGGFPRDFLAAYAEVSPLDDGYRVRKDFYNCYHVLNHANLFAGGYVAQGLRLIEEVLAQV